MKNFHDEVGKVVKQAYRLPLTGFGESLEWLELIKKQILASMRKEFPRQPGVLRPDPQDIDVLVEAGFEISWGIQFNLIIYVPSLKWRDVLFRMYIPMPRGVPIHLDLGGDDPVFCKDKAQAGDQIIKFLSSDEVMMRLNSYIAASRRIK